MAVAEKAIGKDWSALGFPVSNPLALATIEGHWRASNTPLGAVPSFIDRSKKLRHLPQAVSGLQPVNTAAQINGLPGVIYDGADDYNELLNFVIPQPWEFWILFKRIAFSSGDFFFELGVASLATYAQDQAATNLRFVSSGVTFNVNVGAAGGWHLLRIASRVGANASFVHLDNNPALTTPSPTGTLTTGINRLTLGAKIGGTLTPNWEVADMFVASSALTAAEAAMVYGYYRKRYALAIP